LFEDKTLNEPLAIFKDNNLTSLDFLSGDSKEDFSLFSGTLEGIIHTRCITATRYGIEVRNSKLHKISQEPIWTINSNKTKVNFSDQNL